jgi:outer membrane protein
MANRSLYLAIGLSAVGISSTVRATTLDAATSTALATSPNLGAARSLYLKSEAGIGVAAARGHLQVNLTSTATHDFGNDPYTPRIRDESSLRLTLPLYSGGRVRNSVAAARLRAAASAHDIAARSDDLVISVAEQYDRLLDADDAVTIQQQEVDALDRHVSMIAAEQAQGQATRTDDAQGQARRALAQARLLTASERRDEARIAYQQVVGEDAGLLTVPAPLAVPGDIQKLTDAAVAYSPNLQAWQERIRAATRDVATSRGLGRPTLGVSGTGSYGNTDMRLAQPMRFPHRLFGRIGLTLTVPLYAGGQVSAQAARAQAAVEQTRADAERDRRQLVAEVRDHYNAYQGALRRIAAADTARDAAGKALDGVRIEHEAGTRTALDLLNAQQEYSERAGQASRARRQAHFEAVALLVRTGAYVTGEAEHVPQKQAEPRHAETMPAKASPAGTAVAKLDFDLGRLPGSSAMPDDRTARKLAPLPYALDRLG